MESNQLVLGIDGGGSKTVAWLATCPVHEKPQVVGRGTAGPSNPHAVGFPEALENLNRAIAAAFGDASVEPGPVASAVLGLAGSDRQENRQRLRQWADQCRLAQGFQVVHDALPVLAAGSPEGWGVALISGTGSLAFGRARDGRTARAGGWGYLFGDEGSGYAMALAGLRAAAQAADGRGPDTQLLAALLKQLELARPEELISAVYPMASDRAWIASLARTVTDTANRGDQVAQRIVTDAAGELAAMAEAVARELGFHKEPFPLALAGSLLLGSDTLADQLQARLAAGGRELADPARVPEPVWGAVLLAQRKTKGK